MTDRLSLANALSEAKIDRSAAERIATEIFEAIHDNVATKADVQAVQAEVAQLRVATQADVQAVRAEVGQLRGELNARIDLVEHRLVTRIGSVVVIVAGVLFAALHYVH